nr:uncharacterized protein LOC113737315 [Coffea arabica]
MAQQFLKLHLSTQNTYVEMMNLKEMQQTLESEMLVLRKHAQSIMFKQQKARKYIFKEVVTTKNGLQSTDAIKEQGSDGQKCTESLEGHLYEGETSHWSSEKSPRVESDYSLLKKQLMDDLNFENVPEEERAKLQENHVIPLEDLIEGSADWAEFVKGLSKKARS